MDANGTSTLNGNAHQLEMFIEWIGDRRIFLQALPSAHFTFMLCGHDGAESFHNAITQLDPNGDAKGVYYNINPMKPATRKAPQNQDIDRRRILYIDVDDPDHDLGIPATDEGKAAAKTVHAKVIAYLGGRGYTAPAQLDSGNGYAAYYPIDLPNDEPTAGLIAEFLTALQTKFGPLVDTGVHDARRISRIPGTMNRRGVATPDRPHRKCLLIDVPELSEPVTVEMIRGVIADLKKPNSFTCEANGGLRPGDDFNRREPWMDILEPAGWRIERTKGDQIYWTRPGKTGGISASTGYCKTEASGDLLYVFSTGAPPFKDDETYSKFAAFALLNHAGDFGAAAKALAAQGYGSPSSKRNPPNAPPAGASAPADATLEGVIEEYLRKKYNFTFRRGADAFADALGRLIPLREACGAPTSDLIEPLMAVKDFPRGQDGPVRARFPSIYRAWAPIAWANLLAALPDEADSPEMTRTAAEEFQGLVADAMMTIEAFSHKYRNGTEEKMEIQRRSLIEWCRLFAKAGPWASVRSLALWVKLDEEGQLQIAVHQRLFGQIRRGNLAPKTHREFSALCEMYSVGVVGRTSRSAFVILTPEFIADLNSTPCEGRREGDGDAAHTCVREADASHAHSHAPSHAEAGVNDEDHL